MRASGRYRWMGLRAGVAAATAFAVLVPTAAALAGAFSLSGHGSTTGGVNRAPSLYARGECSHCHESHASQDADATLYPYGLFAREENACWPCHDGSTPNAADAKVPYSATPVNTATDYYKHPTSSLYSGTTPSAHRAGESAADAFGTGRRHAECTDCHDPHSAKNDGTAGRSIHTPGGATGNRLSGALLGATGLVVSSWQPAGAAFSSASYAVQPLSSQTTNYEWQICLKCHSSFTTLPTFTAVGSGNFLARKITNTAIGQVKEYLDLGQAFNPNNLSFHPVAAVGRNMTIPAASFVSPWATSSTMYCSDCHTKAAGTAGAAGPHGSSNMHILEKPAYLTENTHYSDTSWGASIGVDPNDLCFKCHRWQTYARKPGSAGSDPATSTNFRDSTSENLHAEHLGDWARGATCYTCHDVHGTNKEHLINFNLAYVTTNSGSQGAFTNTANGGSCNLTCHGEPHSPQSYSR